MTGGDHMLDAMALARVGLREAAAIVRTAAVLAGDRGPLPEPIRTPGLPPVVLVHGYLATPAALRPLARRLLAEGVPEVALVSYDSVSCSLEAVVDAIAREALPLAARFGPVDVVGHSLGAFATRTWIKCFGGHADVRRFVSLGGPHAGTVLHRLIPGPLRGVLDPAGAWVQRVNTGPEPVPTIVVRARYDHQVVPPVAACIPNAVEVVLDGHGHNGLLFATEAHDAVVHAVQGSLERRLRRAVAGCAVGEAAGAMAQ